MWAWQALIEAQRRGLVRSICVQLEKEHLDKIISATGVTPAVTK